MDKLSYWFDKYVEKNGKVYLQINIQGEGICAKGLVNVKHWDKKTKNIKRVKGKSYRGAEFRGLRFTIEENEEEINLVYQNLSSIID